MLAKGTEERNPKLGNESEIHLFTYSGVPYPVKPESYNIIYADIRVQALCLHNRTDLKILSDIKTTVRILSVSMGHKIIDSELESSYLQLRPHSKKL